MSDTETTIRPALTPEQWRDALRDRAGMAAALQRAWGDGDRRENDHALAALALVFQPFGFTREDVKLFTVFADDLEANLNHARLLQGDAGQYDVIDAIRSVADRIAALLPPERTD